MNQQRRAGYPANECTFTSSSGAGKLYVARVQIIVEAIDEIEAESIIETFLTETGVNIDGSKIIDWMMISRPSVMPIPEGSEERGP